MNQSEENPQTDEPKPIVEWVQANQPTILLALFISYTMGAFDYASSTVQGCFV